MKDRRIVMGKHVSVGTAWPMESPLCTITIYALVAQTYVTRLRWGELPSRTGNSSSPDIPNPRAALSRGVLPAPPTPSSVLRPHEPAHLPARPGPARPGSRSAIGTWVGDENSGALPQTIGSVTVQSEKLSTPHTPSVTYTQRGAVTGRGLSWWWGPMTKSLPSGRET